MMFRNRWYAAALALSLAIFNLSCSRKYSPKPISAEAAAAFGRAEAGEMGGSLVIDAEVMRELGFRPGGDAAQGELAVDFAVNLLPMVAAELKDETGPMLARAAVLLALARDWAIAPHVQRVGVTVEVDPVDPERSADRALVLLAVKEGAGETRELLQGVGAAIRAVAGRELVQTEKGDLCVAKATLPEVPFQLCVHPGDGLIAIGTAAALAGLATPPPAPAARDSGPLLRLVVQVPLQGKGELVLEGHGALRMAGRFEPSDPKLADVAEKTLQELLQKADEQREKSKKVMAGALAQVKESLDADPDAPARMKTAVGGARADKLLDPRGEYEAIRSSVKVGRAGKVVTAELTIPEGQVRRAVQLDSGLLTTAATVGVLSAIAIPNFIKYQCRSRTSEAPVVLKDAWQRMQAHKAERGAWATRLEETGYKPAPASHYTLCLAGSCVAPVDSKAAEACEAAEESVKGASAGPSVCAAMDLGGGSMDVWLIGESGEPDHFRDGCR